MTTQCKRLRAGRRLRAADRHHHENGVLVRCNQNPAGVLAVAFGSAPARECVDTPRAAGVAVRWLWPAVTVILFAGSGATCNRQWLPPFAGGNPAAPAMLTPGAQIEQIAAAINQNAARIRTLHAPHATITIPDAGALLPALRGSIALERPQRFRLTAGTGLSGPEVDMGSNDERFWLWVKRNQPPAVYFCRHSQFAGSAAHQLLPIEPGWLHSALGVVELDPASVYQGPTAGRDGSIVLRTYLPSPHGSLHRELVIDAETAWVREQYVYDTTGQHLIASAVAHSHRYHELHQVSLPDRVTVRLPTAQLAFTIDVGQWQINQPPAGLAQMWNMPSFEGFQQIDLGSTPATMPLPFGGPGYGQSNLESFSTGIRRQTAMGEFTRELPPATDRPPGPVVESNRAVARRAGPGHRGPTATTGRSVQPTVDAAETR